MGQEHFAGPEYVEEFDPERFAEQIKKEAAQRRAAESDGTDETAENAPGVEE